MRIAVEKSLRSRSNELISKHIVEPTFLFWYTHHMKKSGAKKTITRAVYQYTAVFDPDKDGGFTVTIPSLPGCISEGDTFEESLKNIKEAASLYLETLQEENLEIPQEQRGVVITPIEVKV